MMHDLHQPFAPETNQQKFFRLFNSGKISEVFILDADGRIIETDNKVGTITHYKAEDITGEHISILYSERDRHDLLPEKELEHARRKGKHAVSGFRYAKNGTPFFAKMKLSHNPGVDGRAEQFRVILSDHTHRAMYAVDNRRIREQYLSLFNNTFVGIFTFRRDDYRFQSLNQKALDIIGVNNDVTKVSEMFNNIEEFKRFIGLLSENKSVEGFRFHLNSGSCQKLASVSCRPCQDPSFIGGLLSEVGEITVKNPGDADRETYHVVEAATKSLQEPVAILKDLAHQIRFNPEQRPLPEYTMRIESSVRLIDSVARDLSQLSYISTQPLRYESIQLASLLEEIVAPLKLAYPVVNCTVDVRGTNLFIGDLTRLTIIFKNIISNAFKFHRLNTMQQRVLIRVDLTSQCLIAQVEDNGTGIEKDVLEKLFTGTAPIGCERRHGLSLYVAGKALDKLKGKIDVVSRPALGTCFTFSIPNRTRS